MYKPKEYCTQPRDEGQTCFDCSLCNYGRDCMNIPIEPDSETKDEKRRLMIKKAFDSLKCWRDQYSLFKEFTPLFEAIDNIKIEPDSETKTEDGK